MDIAIINPISLHIIGKKGSGLSGGQRQRIVLARALLVKPPILILDEATSALDYESEAAIMANMEQICDNRTVIAIAHRLNTIKHANRILVLDQGMIAEQGSHAELLQQQGIYSMNFSTVRKLYYNFQALQQSYSNVTRRSPIIIGITPRA